MSRPDLHPEKPLLRLGLMPLIDAVPLAVAAEKGYFAAYGLDVELSLESSWAGLRDKLALGLLDAAQMPAPMPIAASLNLDGMNVPMLTALSLNLNGNAITLSSSLYQRLLPYLSNSPDPSAYARALAQTLAAERAENRPPPTFAHVFPYSKHHYELRLWLQAGGIDAERDVRLIVVPPQQMVERLASGSIDGFCVGAPWSEVARMQGIGHIVARSYDLWNNGPEKVLGVTQAWAGEHPRTHLAVVAALIEAGRWLDQVENRREAAELLLRCRYIDAPPQVVTDALRLDPAAEPLTSGGLLFHLGATAFPWRSHARWFAEQMLACGQLKAGADIEAVIASSYRPDLHREAAAICGEPCPLADEKMEDLHDTVWRLPAEQGGIAAGPDRWLKPASN